jgi:RimJ/RimL family protein N-acetyltransferase
MKTLLFDGALVRITAEEPRTFAEAWVRWNRDSEFSRLSNASAAYPSGIKQAQAWFEKPLEKDDPNNFSFAIRTLDGNRLIGGAELEVCWNNRETFLGIGIGEREYWGKGYGSDALRVLLRYAFSELNLHRVALDVFEYNPRAIRCYEKVGFTREGSVRGFLERDGRRWDLVFMGILREEWLTHEPQNVDMQPSAVP